MALTGPQIASIVIGFIISVGVSAGAYKLNIFNNPSNSVKFAVATFVFCFALVLVLTLVVGPMQDKNDEKNKKKKN